LHSTWVLQSKVHAWYGDEMNDAQHAELLDALLALRGFVVVSSYQSDLYSDWPFSWDQGETKARISAGCGTPFALRSFKLIRHAAPRSIKKKLN
jgi:hypothetical protein